MIHAFIQSYNDIIQKTKFFYKQLNLSKYENKEGRPLSLTIIETISLAVFKQLNGIPTKKAIFNIFKPDCVYKTLVVNINRFATLALLILSSILKLNQRSSHLVKHTDSTDIPVCSNKNGKHHKTMKGLADWGYSGKGLFYGLKMHITTDLERKMLAIKFTSGNVHDKEVFMKLNKDLLGLFVADAAYISKKLSSDFHLEGQRILFSKPRKNMKKIMTGFQHFLYRTRMLIELNFKNLKQFYGLITSLPRSINGYLSNYIYSLLAYHFA